MRAGRGGESGFEKGKKERAAQKQEERHEKQRFATVLVPRKREDAVK